MGFPVRKAGHSPAAPRKKFFKSACPASKRPLHAHTALQSTHALEAEASVQFRP